MTGSGMESLFPDAEEQRVRTEFGTVRAYLASAGGSSFVVIPRHGKDHEVPPHLINFRANVRAMKKLGANDVIATSAVGSISKKIDVGTLGLLDQFLDFTKRHLTYFGGRPVHVDMTRPYDPVLQRRLLHSARGLRTRLVPGLVYVSVEGPRYETAAEVRMFALLGGDVVGMTGAPEAILCRELGLRYASVVVATNRAAGIQASVSHSEVVEIMEKVRPRVKMLLERTVADW